MIELHPNHRALTPLLFLQRTAKVFATKTAVVYGGQTWTYAQFAERCNRLGSALVKAGIGPGDCVSYLCPNTPPMLEAHYGVPYSGAILGAINIRLAPKEIEYILRHSGTKALFVDAEFSHLVEEILPNLPQIKFVVNISDGGLGKPLPQGTDYEAFLEHGDPWPPEIPVADETGPIAVNYTSGTTGNPKGVLFTHRSVYLNALGLAIEGGLSSNTNYLWTVPMFHCNGWCFTWGVTAVGGRHVCLRKVDPAAILSLIKSEKITTFCGAPTVLISLYSHPDAQGFRAENTITVFTGGAPPSPTVIRNSEALNININHIYGLTETYGPHTMCEWQPHFDGQGEEYRSRMKARQGVPHITAHEVRVVDENMDDVIADGEHPGEIVMRGNNVMKGYFNDPEATAKAFRGGWFHSGDVAVMWPDGYIEIRDRSKDIIISGGENISSIEVENTLYRHPAIQEVAVVAVPHEKWGEVPKGFVALKPGAAATEEEVIAFCRDNLSHFKCPKSIEFGELPKTSTGKIKKFVLREKEWAGREKRVN